MRMHPWWDSPVWQMQLDYDTEFHQSVMDEAYYIAKDIQSGKDQFPKDSLWEYSRPNIDKLKSDVLNIVRSTVIKGIAEAKQLNLDCEYTGGWINVIEPGDKIEVHAHNDCSLVMTYYLKVPEGSGDFTYLDTKYIITDSGEFIPEMMNDVTIKRITPKEGMLLLFPAYLLHEVEANKSNDLRVSLSGDIKQIIDKSVPNAMVLRNWCNSFLKLKEWSPK